MLDGNPVTRKRVEKAGAQVAVFSGEQICRKGAGGPTCLTRPILASWVVIPRAENLIRGTQSAERDRFQCNWICSRRM
jgi:hypothetical protein